MKKNEIMPCEGKEVKLVLDNGYVLYGQINEIFEDCIFFCTPLKKSFIRLDAVKEIIF